MVIFGGKPFVLQGLSCFCQQFFGVTAKSKYCLMLFVFVSLFAHVILLLLFKNFVLLKFRMLISRPERMFYFLLRIVFGIFLAIF